MPDERRGRGSAHSKSARLGRHSASFATKFGFRVHDVSLSMKVLSTWRLTVWTCVPDERRGRGSAHSKSVRLGRCSASFAIKFGFRVLVVSLVFGRVDMCAG